MLILALGYQSLADNWLTLSVLREKINFFLTLLIQNEQDRFQEFMN